MKNVIVFAFLLIASCQHDAVAGDSAGAMYSTSLACDTEQGTLDAIATAGTTQTVTLTANKDTYIRLGTPSTNFGGSNDLFVDRETTDLQRLLVQFDLSSIPAGSTVTGAFLRLQASSVDGVLQLDVYRLLESWAELEASWLTRSTGINWTTPGGEFNATALTNFTTDLTGQHTFVITSLTQAWFSGAAQNHGVLIATASAAGSRKVTYDTREKSGGVKPALQVFYTVPSVPPGCLDLQTGESLTITSYSSSSGLYTATANGNVVHIPASAVAIH